MGFPKCCPQKEKLKNSEGLMQIYISNIDTKSKHFLMQSWYFPPDFCSHRVARTANGSQQAKCKETICLIQKVLRLLYCSFKTVPTDKSKLKNWLLQCHSCGNIQVGCEVGVKLPLLCDKLLMLDLLAAFIYRFLLVWRKKENLEGQKSEKEILN